MATRTDDQSSENPIEVSFEFFPPKTEKMEQTLWASIEKLAPLNPRFVSVTYGAGGSTRERTHSTVKRIVDETSLKPAAHLTCVEATREEIDGVIQDYWDAGIRHIVALRGDPPSGIGEKYVPFEGGYANAAELAAGISKIAPFEISVGCYPEKHPESASFDADIDLLKAKIDGGATRAISQFFVETDNFLRFVDRARSAGIDIPIVPGIMPVGNVAGYLRMSAATGTSVPDWFKERFDGLDDDPETRQLVALSVAAEQVQKLADQGIQQFHLYTLNRAETAFALCHILGVRPDKSLAA
ncbi:5,10-methylenetetrahydrofolate reductase [Candidatus Phaeomarinobacter ectocarpi]|uniref:Methylenetetrahydrofolate reductase n=1 Tax=Candidatus Phaeomarinibacter ectocarpi TaxID=1458461 RepID=X5MC11_9HYPH|nr:methylenetetrahydrofolate reductase [NAD(P)H] [Candidatus Phaeomarinobacter ectocarpi]CDO58697.1 5,10-methylenetetrahydrofolate reductase [Candidatus Phaeomarinobacter ectocarpi]